VAIGIHHISNKNLDYDAWVSIDSLRNGMSFGGCRFYPGLTAAEVIKLSQCMTQKLLLHGLPVGGAKSGLRVDTSREDLMEVLTDFAIQAKSILAESVMMGKDLGATNEIIDHIYDSAGLYQTEIVKNHLKKDCPRRLREFNGYIDHMTAQGAVWSTLAIMNSLGASKAVIQGAGAVGLGLLYRLNQAGINVHGISDQQKFYYSKDPILFNQFSKYVDRGKISKDLPGVVSNPDPLLMQECDIVFLAASSNSVHESLAEGIKAQLIVEVSNFGLTDSAEAKLIGLGKTIIPDVLANSSSAALVAYQMSTANDLASTKVWQMIEQNIVTTTRQTFACANKQGVGLRQAYLKSIIPELKSRVTGAQFS
jgi:glutamate dehydrogenase (NAD(P)+)